MKLVAGLGNPGFKYEMTRHNLGFRIVNQLAQELDINSWEVKAALKAEIAQVILGKEKIILAKPQTFMNQSGQAIRKIKDYYKIESEQILIIHDDIDLPLGKILIQKRRGSAGHRGVESIIENLGTKDFIRARIGIQPEKTNEDVEKFVLGKFTFTEEKIIQEIIKKAAQHIRAAL